MAYKIYPVTRVLPDAGDYRVLVNGKEVVTDTARVSAVPFNRRWPGHQRGMEQTELISFLSLALDEPITIEVFPREPFEKVEIRPRRANLTYTVTERGSILISLRGPQYFTVEPYGRQRALHVFADPMPQYDVAEGDAGVLYFGAGEHEVGMIYLESNQTLYLDEGAVVYACVRAKDAENVRILGRGILDNSHNKETILFEANAVGNEMAVKNAKRLHTVQIEYCKNVVIDGITIRDSLVYNVRPMATRGLTIQNVKIIGCWRYNSDGIDMHNCEDVRIENCFLRTYDDSICVKGMDCYYDGDVEAAVYEAIHHGGEVYDTFRHVEVRACVIWNDWGRALEIGAETRAEEMSDILFEDCDIIHITSDVLDCQNVDYADIHDVTWRNVCIELDDPIPEPRLQRADAELYEAGDPDYAPPMMCAGVCFHPEYSAGGTRRGRNHRLRFENVDIWGRQKPLLRFYGYGPDAMSSDIVVKNVRLNGVSIVDSGEYTLEIGDFCEGVILE